MNAGAWKAAAICLYETTALPKSQELTSYLVRIPGIMNRKIRKATPNIAHCPAMGRYERRQGNRAWHRVTNQDIGGLGIMNEMETSFDIGMQSGNVQWIKRSFEGLIITTWMRIRSASAAPYFVQQVVYPSWEGAASIIYKLLPHARLERMKLVY